MKIKPLSRKITYATRSSRVMRSHRLNIQHTNIFYDSQHENFDHFLQDDSDADLSNIIANNLVEETASSYTSSASDTVDISTYQELLHLDEKVKSQSQIDQAQIDQTKNKDTDKEKEKDKPQTIMVSCPPMHISLPSCAWEILWITLKLAKVFPAPQCEVQQTQGGSLSIYDLQKVRMHIEHVIFTSMESGDFLMSDLTLSDVDPDIAFVEGDSRRTEYLDRATLERLVSFIKQVKGSVNVRALHWNFKPFQKKK